MEFIRKGTKDLLQVHKKEELCYLTFPAFTKTGLVEHLFSTRMGGVSSGEFSTLNFSYTRGDKKEAVDENYKRIAAALSCTVEDIVCSDQTHTTNIRIVTDMDRGKGCVRPKDYTDVDGLLTNIPGITLATFYADCVPLYFLDTKKQVIGLAHSGWRGTVNRMGQHMITTMEKEFACNREDLIVAIGPSICKDCYEVSKDVADLFFKEFGDSVLTKGKEEGKFQLDLWKANELVFLQAGLKKEQISVTDICTCCNSELLFSHRASHGRRGNLGAFLKLK